MANFMNIADYNAAFAAMNNQLNSMYISHLMMSAESSELREALAVRTDPVVLFIEETKLGNVPMFVVTSIDNGPETYDTEPLWEYELCTLIKSCKRYYGESSDITTCTYPTGKQDAPPPALDAFDGFIPF